MDNIIAISGIIILGLMFTLPFIGGTIITERSNDEGKKGNYVFPDPKSHGPEAGPKIGDRYSWTHYPGDNPFRRDKPTTYYVEITDIKKGRHSDKVYIRFSPVLHEELNQKKIRFYTEYDSTLESFLRQYPDKVTKPTDSVSGS